MALWFELRVNRQAIGLFTAQRREDEIPADRVCTYDVSWAVPGNPILATAEVRHDYDDGALILVAKALSQLDRK